MLGKAEAYGYKNCAFILDRGYFSESNIRYMERNGYDFIIMVKGCKELVNQAILKHKGSFEDEWQNAIPYYDENGITVKEYLFKSDEKKRYFHIYYNDFKKARERAKLQKKIREQKEALEKLKGTEVIFGEKNLGYFDLIN